MLVDAETIPRVALQFMNDDHAEEVRLLNDLVESLAALRAGRGSASIVAARFAAFEEHTRVHFGREEDAMRRAGFAPYPVHKAEHDHVLHEMSAEGARFRSSGDVARLWAYVTQAVPTWFVGHVESMDFVTARFLAAAGGA